MIPYPQVTEEVRAANYHHLFASGKMITPETPGVVCALCDRRGSREELVAEVCPEHVRKGNEYSAQFINLIKAVLATNKTKVTPLSGPNAGRRIKVRVEENEKLVRILAVFHTLDPEFYQVLDNEAKNRLTISSITGSKPWE